MADFLAKFIGDIRPTQDRWNLYVDGMSNEKGSGASIILERPNNVTLERALKFNFMASNNQAEYEALIEGLKLQDKLGQGNSDATMTRSLSKDRLQTNIKPMRQRYSDTIMP